MEKITITFIVWSVIVILMAISFLFYLWIKHTHTVYSKDNEQLPKPNFNASSDYIKKSREDYFNDIGKAIVNSTNGEELIKCLISINEFDKLFGNSIDYQNLIFMYLKKERRLKKIGALNSETIKTNLKPMPHLCLLKNESNSFIVVNDNSPEKFDYETSGYSEIAHGKLDLLENEMNVIWDDNNTPEDERIYKTVK
jgi:hypothetical protein